MMLFNHGPGLYQLSLLKVTTWSQRQWLEYNPAPMTAYIYKEYLKMFTEMTDISKCNMKSNLCAMQVSIKE